MPERKQPAKRAPAKRARPAPPPPAPRRGFTVRLPSGFATIRDVLTFVAGMAIIVHEVWLSKELDPAAIAVGVTLAGVPLVFGADEKRKSGEAK